MKLKLVVFAFMILFSGNLKAMSESYESNEKLLKAALYSDLKLAQQALKEGANIETRDKGNEDTPLLRAVHQYPPRSLSIINFLIESGANVNARNAWGSTPLILLLTARSSAETETLAISMLLLTNGADINIKDDQGGSAIDYAYTDKIKSFFKLWPELAKILKKDKEKKLSKELSEANIFSDIQGIRDIIAEYTIDKPIIIEESS